jgi:hypothetical protein
MRKLAGYVFDPYDDLDGRVLKSLVPDSSGIPEFIKTAHQLTEGQRMQLPDDCFALVMLDEGTKLKKYAMVDKGNTALSVMYLGSQAHLLPPEAVKTAALNLCHACQVHSLEAPSWLKMAAKTGITGVSGKSQAPYAKGAKVNKIQFPVPTEPKESTENPQLGKADDHDVVERTNMGGTQGTNFLEMPVFSQKEKARNDGAAVEKRASMEVATREQVTRTSPYVDMAGWNPEPYQVEDHQNPSRTLLGNHYPVDSYEQTKVASVYFEENWKHFHPRDRHEYCVKLAARMEELGIKVPEDVERYGSETYAADVDDMVNSRRNLVDLEQFGPALDTLIEKRAQIEPGTFAEAVAEFDYMSGLNLHWDGAVVDPWFTTFGPSLEKVAAAEWSWDGPGVRVDEPLLDDLALNGKFLLKKQFGPDFQEKFAKNPKGTFTGLPKATQVVLARMAMDKHSGNPTE